METSTRNRARRGLQGPVVPLTTPIRQDDTVDYDGLARLVGFYIDHGIKSFIAAGTTGYCYALRPEEHEQVVATTVQASAGLAYVIAGVSHSGTGMANDLADRCERVGADALLMVPPYYHQTSSPDGCFKHYKSVSENHSLPMIVYNTPYSAFDVAFFRRCAEVENIIAIKEARGEYNFARDLLVELGERFLVLSGGSMRYYLWHWLWGAAGYVTSVANLVPEIELRFYRHLRQHDLKAAVDIVKQIEQPFLAIMIEYGWHASLHVALKVFGLPAEKLRLPLVEPPPEHVARMKQEFERIGILQPQ